MLGGLGFDKFCCTESGAVSAKADTAPLLFNIDADGDFQPYAQGRVSEYEMGYIFFVRSLALIGKMAGFPRMGIFSKSLSSWF